MSASPWSPCEVHPYTIQALEGLLAEKASSDPSVVSSKLHRTYFEEYFSFIGAKTIVVENYYIDHDYTDDYSKYYVRCFAPYRRTCVRLHFFDVPFAHDDLDGLIAGSNSSLPLDVLTDAYLGFIVVKPLPQSFVGRTCLRTYPTENTGRSYPITRQYDANLFGFRLTVDTLAFQEQDSVAAACATSALWSAFQGTGKLFQHTIPSPIEITKAATAVNWTNARTLPNSGLTIEQMAAAIRSLSLEPLAISVENDEYLLQILLYAYLKGKIPVVLLLMLGNISVSPTTTYGLHAVTVTGFHLEASAPKAFNGFLLRAGSMDKIYVHDDQVGPFARMVFDGVVVPIGTNSFASLSTSWLNSIRTSNLRAIPTFTLTPLYDKIRIPFTAVFGAVFQFDALIEQIRLRPGTPVLPDRLQWDIYLSTAGDYKSDVVPLRPLAPAERQDVLLQSMPRFIWCASAYCNGQVMFDLLFDATDIESGKVFMRAIEYNSGISSQIRTTIAASGSAGFIPNAIYRAIIDWFR